MSTEAKQRFITTYQSSYVEFPSFFEEKVSTYEDQKFKANLMANGMHVLMYSLVPKIDFLTVLFPLD